MKAKIREVSGPVLDWMVAKVLGWNTFVDRKGLQTDFTDDGWKPSTDWAQGGPIIEDNGIHLEWSESHEHWLAYSWDRFSNPNHHVADGDTALIAAMRCYVASRLGDEVEVPDELV